MYRFSSIIIAPLGKQIYCIPNGAFLFFWQGEFYWTLKYDIIIFEKQEQFTIACVE